MKVDVASSGLLPLVERGLYETHPRRGIVHVGANDGAELSWYLNRNLSPVLCFEPNPVAFKRALLDWGGRAEVDFVRMALGAKSGTVEMGIPADGDDEKTSRYHPIPTEGHDWTAIPVAETISVPVMRFDEWVSEHAGYSPLTFGTLVIDVQGMEMEVLEGFGTHLQSFDFLCVELSETPMYDGEPPAEAVTAFLAEQGFKRETEIVEHGDVCFSRR